MNIFNFKNKKLLLSKNTLVMGIVNVTPDSFSDGGSFLLKEKAIEHAQSLVKDGADIIDIGGESTRPFAESVSVDEELKRVIPVIKVLTRLLSVPISIDTTKAEVAEKALHYGASIVNDISSLSDIKMAKTIAKYQAGLVLMHIRGTPKNMQLDLIYNNMLGEIKKFLHNSIKTAINAGINRSSIIIDPGLGFGKSVEQNFEIIKRLKELLEFKVPILIGSSRKSFISKTLESKLDTHINPKSTLSEMGTQATIAASVMNGAKIVRVHDVATTKATLHIIDMIKIL